MIKKLTFTTAAICFGAAAFASDVSYDQNEALSAETIAEIKTAYADDFTQPATAVVARFDGDTEAWSQDQMALIKAAFTAAE